MKRRWFSVSALVAAACLISVFSARRIEAQFSSPVKVVNTTSAPAITSGMDDHGRIPYWSEVDGGIAVSGQDCLSGCQFTFGPVPGGHRLVIERVSAALDLSGQEPGTIFVSMFPQIGGAGTPNSYAAFVAPPTEFFDVPTLAYVDSQESIVIRIILSGGAPLGISNHVIVRGYLLDCTAAPCAAIAH